MAALEEMRHMDGREDGRVVELDERRLLPRHHQGDERAFAQLLDAYRRPVYSYLVRCGLDDSTRDDLFQDIFLKVHKAAGSYQPSRPLKPWLFTIVANTVRSHFRRFRPHELAIDYQGAAFADPSAAPDTIAEARDTVAWLEHAVRSLSLPQREVLLLTCVDGMPQLEVATALQIPVNTVKTHLRRARLKLAQALLEREHGPEPEA